MSFSFFIIFLISSCACLEYHKLEKNVPLEFKLEEENSLYYASLDYLENYEPNDNIIDNNIYFFKIDKSLKVVCLLNNIDSEPDETTLNNETETNYCQFSIDLQNEKKLINFPKNITNETKLYIALFLDDESKENFDAGKNYRIERVSFPQLLDIKDYKIELGGKETLIYLMDEKITNSYNMLSTLYNFNIYIYALTNGSFTNLGYIGENKLMYQYNHDDNIKLESDYLFVVINNHMDKVEQVKFSYFEYIHLHTFNLNETSDETLQFNTIITMIEIYNPENKIIKFGFPEEIIVRVFEDKKDNFKLMENLIDYSYYKYIPSGKFYSPKAYSLFIVNKGENPLSELSFSAIDFYENDTQIEMDNFLYFKILQNEQLSFNITYPKEKIILKNLGDISGGVEIFGQKYNLKEENQIIEIDPKDNTEFKIKSLDNDLILGVRSKVSKEFIQYANVGADFKVPTENNKTFIIYNLDYDNYDYIYFKIDNSNKSDIFKISTDFGLFSENEIDKNEYLSTICISGIFYDLQYYNNDKNKYLDHDNKNVSRIYYISDISNYTNIVIRSTYYKELIYNAKNFTKNWYENLLNYENKKIRFFFLTDNSTNILFICGNNQHGVSFSNSFVYYFQPKSDFYCYTKLSFYGYVIGEQYENDEIEYSFDEEKGINSTELKELNSSYFELSFDYNFTNSTHINYTLILSYAKNKEELFSTRVQIFENFYLNNKYKSNKEFKFYNFSLDNLTYNSSLSNISSIVFPLDAKFRNNETISVLIAETSPSKMINIYNSKIYNFSAEEPAEEPAEKRDKNMIKKLTIVTIVLIVIILVATIVLIRYYKRKKDIEELVADDSLKEGINVSMKNI